MKDLNQYIKESILDDDDHLTNKTMFRPKDEQELFSVVRKELKEGNYDLNFIDTSNITNMEGLFADLYTTLDIDKNEVIELKIDKWDVSKVKYMESMFWGGFRLHFDVSKWNVSNVVSMKSMFKNCKDFDNDLSKWNVSNVKDMSHMFSCCENFNCDISGWNTDTVSSAQYMFFNCGKFVQDLSRWDMPRLVKASDMFLNTKMPLKYLPRPLK